MRTQVSQLFSPDLQAGFWEAIEPDVRNFLRTAEQLEGWVYRPEDLPDLFHQTVAVLPLLQGKSMAQSDAVAAAESFIPLLASMPLRLSVTAIVWLHHHAASVDLGEMRVSVSWSQFFYSHVEQCSRNEAHVYRLFAVVIIKRLDLLARLKLAGQLFHSFDFPTKD